jgi:hypothetical protein
MPATAMRAVGAPSGETVAPDAKRWKLDIPRRSAPSSTEPARGKS